MLIHPRPKGRAEQIGDEALASLNLPASTCFPLKEHADAYRILGQLLLAHKNHKKISEFLENKQSTIDSLTAKPKTLSKHWALNASHDIETSKKKQAPLA